MRKVRALSDEKNTGHNIKINDTAKRGSSWERASYIHSRGRRETRILLPPFGCIINLPNVGSNVMCIHELRYDS